MLALITLEVLSSLFDITEENNEFELYTKNIDEISSSELKDELEEIAIISYISPQHLQHEKTGLKIIEEYKKLKLEKTSTEVILCS